MRVDTQLVNYLKTIFVSRRDASSLGGTLSPYQTDTVDLGKPNLRFDRIYARTVVAENFTASTRSISDADTLDGFHASATPTADTILPLDPTGVFPASVYPDALLLDGSRTLTGNLAVAAGITVDGVDISAHAASDTLHHIGGMLLDDHTQYVHKATARTITAVHTFDPGVPGAPFIIGTNGLHEVVAGLRAAEVDVTLTAGDGLTGGGLLDQNRTISVNPGTGLMIEDSKVRVKPRGETSGLLMDVDGVGIKTPSVSGLTVDATGVFVKLKTASGLALDTNGLYVNVGSHLTVASDALDVALSSDFSWSGLHVFNNNIQSAHITPISTDTYDLGSSLKLWRQAFISQLNAVIFAEQTVSLLGGWLIVGKGECILDVDLPPEMTTAVQLDRALPDFPANPAATPYFLLIRAKDVNGAIKAEYFRVTGVDDEETHVYLVERDKAGAHAGGLPSWPAGTVILVLGQSGSGRIELNAYDSPRIQLVSQGSTYNAQTELVRIGDLNGWGPIATSSFGWAVGAYAADGNTGKYAYYNTTDGMVIRGTIKADGGYLKTMTISGVLTVGSGGGIYQGTGTFASPDTGVKIWLDGTIGRIAGYGRDSENAVVAKWYSDTTGQLMAGGGAVVLNHLGLKLYADMEGGNGLITWLKSGTGAVMAELQAGHSTSGNTQWWHIYPSPTLTKSALFFDDGSFNNIFALGEHTDGVGWTWAKRLAVGDSVAATAPGAGAITASGTITSTGGSIIASNSYVQGMTYAFGNQGLGSQPVTASYPGYNWGVFYQGADNLPWFINPSEARIPAFQKSLTFPVGAGVPWNGATAVIVNNVTTMAFPNNTSYPMLDFAFKMPDGWAGRSYTVRVFWTQSTAGTGDVVFGCELRRLVDANAIPVDGTAGATWYKSVGQTVANPGVGVVKVTTFSMGAITTSEGQHWALRLYRNAPGAADTSTVDANIISIEISVS